MSHKRWMIIIFLAAFLGAGLLGALELSRKRQELGSRFVNFLSRELERSFGLNLEADSFSGSLISAATLDGVRIFAARPEGRLDVFAAEKVSFRYQWLDLFRENFAGWFDVVVKKPRFNLSAPFDMPAAPQVRSFELLSGVAARVRRNARLLIEDGTVLWAGQEGVVSEIRGQIGYRSFNLEMTLDHLRAGFFDLTSVLELSGSLETPVKGESEGLLATLTTRNTIVNWKPMPGESKFHLRITPEFIEIRDSLFFGGLQAKGRIGHSGNRTAEATLVAKNYALGETHEALTFKDNRPIGGLLDGEIGVSGNLLQPHLRGNVTVRNDDASASKLMNLQLSFEGVYPDARISDCRIVMKDGTSMRFSDASVKFIELVDSKTYERLIARSAQEAVAFGDWRLKRDAARDAVSIERSLADRLKVRYERAETDDTHVEKPAEDSSGQQMSLEYLLGGDGSLMMEVREDEKLVGVQKKAQF